MGSHNSTIVSCTINDQIATIVMDDGKSNVVSLNMLRQLNEALDRAEQAKAIVILTGREGMFCAGFDLKTLKTGVSDAFNMVIGGFQLARRLLSFPTPVIIACTGHAMAMGSFLLLSGDYRIGARGDFKIAANEVRIGLTMPYSATTICRQRLTPASFHRAVLLAEVFDPEAAAKAGFLDVAVDAEDLLGEAHERALEFKTLDPKAHRQSKLRMRKQLLRTLWRAILADRFDLVWQGVQRALSR